MPSISDITGNMELLACIFGTRSSSCLALRSLGDPDGDAATSEAAILVTESLELLSVSLLVLSTYTYSLPPTSSSLSSSTLPPSVQLAAITTLFASYALPSHRHYERRLELIARCVGFGLAGDAGHHPQRRRSCAVVYERQRDRRQLHDRLQEAHYPEPGC